MDFKTLFRHLYLNPDARTPEAIRQLVALADEAEIRQPRISEPWVMLLKHIKKTS